MNDYEDSINSAKYHKGLAAEVQDAYVQVLKLSERRKEAIKFLYYKKKFTMKQIAEMYKINKTRISQIIKSLKK